MREKEILAQFQGRRTRCQEIARRIDELQNEVAEHEMVTKTLEPMDKGRRCFRLVGDVLVERTVGEALPAVVTNKENLTGVIKTLTEQLTLEEKDLKEFQAKYQIRIVDKQGRPIGDEPPAAEAASSAAAGKAQGVLVQKK